MSLVNVTSVDVRRNPSTLFEPFELEVVFECLEDLQDDLEWKLIYVGSADNKSLDQELDCVIMGPIHRGALKFTFEPDAPDFSKIPEDDIHGFTILLLTGSYRDEEFIRIGWYVHNTYVDPEVQDDPPDPPQLDKMQRHILTEAPRVTRFKISWDTKPTPFTAYSEIECRQPDSSTSSSLPATGNCEVPSDQSQCPVPNSHSNLHSYGTPFCGVATENRCSNFIPEGNVAGLQFHGGPSCSPPSDPSHSYEQPYPRSTNPTAYSTPQSFFAPQSFGNAATAGIHGGMVHHPHESASVAAHNNYCYNDSAGFRSTPSQVSHGGQLAIDGHAGYGVDVEMR